MNIIPTTKNFLQRCQRPGSPFRYLRKGFGLVRKPIAYWARVQHGAEILRESDPILSQRVGALKAFGFAGAGEELDPRLLAEIDEVGCNRLQKPGKGFAARKFFTDLTDSRDLRSDSTFVRFALQPSILGVASAYFGGKVPYLSGVQLLLSHGSDNVNWEESQLWHRDYSDSRILKLWVYLTDVTGEKNGPFTYLPADASNKVKNDFFFPGRISDEAMETSGQASKAQKVFGPRLTSFYIDTARCYHLGSRLKLGEQRLAYIAAFTTHAQLYPCENGISLDGKVSEIEHLALTL